jgi:hypothetical protein
MFRPIIQELLNIEHFFQIKAFKKTLKTRKIGASSCYSWYCWKALDELLGGNFIIFRP